MMSIERIKKALEMRVRNVRVLELGLRPNGAEVIVEMDSDIAIPAYRPVEPAAPEEPPSQFGMTTRPLRASYSFYTEDWDLIALAQRRMEEGRQHMKDILEVVIAAPDGALCRRRVFGRVVEQLADDGYRVKAEPAGEEPYDAGAAGAILQARVREVDSFIAMVMPNVENFGVDMTTSPEAARKFGPENPVTVFLSVAEKGGVKMDATMTHNLKVLERKVAGAIADAQDPERADRRHRMEELLKAKLPAWTVPDVPALAEELLWIAEGSGE